MAPLQDWVSKETLMSLAKAVALFLPQEEKSEHSKGEPHQIIYQFSLTVVLPSADSLGSLQESPLIRLGISLLLAGLAFGV